ncbi:MAG TPA: ThiF family adenylyltransferase [Candidatus Deferrimicrobium sp.]|nr:ThiF family adenylyltransferase [Candidatus Deferrimicrobium sp.]
MSRDSNFFEKQLQIQGWDQELLQKTHVLVVGVGGIGSIAALAYTRLGVGRLTLVDVDHVEPSNLNRQLLYSKADVGKQKVGRAISNLMAVHSLSTQIEGYDFDIFRDWQRFINLVRQADLVQNALDLPEVKKLAVGSLCLKLRKPMIFAGTDPISGNAGMVLFQRSGGNPCYNCLTAAIDTVHEKFQEMLKPRNILRHKSILIEQMTAYADLSSATNIYTATSVTMMGINLMVHWLFKWGTDIPNRIILDLFNFTCETWSERSSCDFCQKE